MLFSIIAFGQNIKKHEWKNRVLLIISDDKNDLKYRNQLKVLKKDKTELLDRKLVIYEVSKNEYNLNFEEKSIQSSKLFHQFNKENTPFLAILIGLDGGIKLEQDSLLSTEKLFAIIDGMPMRKRELRKNKK